MPGQRIFGNSINNATYMGLSSNILWHQTNFNSLRKILSSKTILCSYSLEDTRFVLGGKTAFAMVSMCDLPFSELTSYLSKYGGYSLGFSRSWGISHKFNPVWYCDPQSMAADFIKHSLERMRRTGSGDGEALLFSNVLSYVKMVEDELPKHNYKRYRFYDEREVRFIPSFLYMINRDEKPLMYEEEYMDYKKSHNGNSLLDFGVEFDWTDLKYIIVKEEKQIQPLRAYLTKQGCPNDLVQIFFHKQVEEDFIGENHNEEVEKFSMTKDDVKKFVEMTVAEMNKIQDAFG